MIQKDAAAAVTAALALKELVALQRSPLQKHMNTRRLLRVTNAQRSWNPESVDKF
jgi:hypothetical protein